MRAVDATEIVFTTKRELYDYLNNFDYDAIKDTALSSVYFLIQFDNRIEPIYFSQFRDVWFESPCELRRYKLGDLTITELVDELYDEADREAAFEYEQTMQRNGWHYEIDCPQCAPFLPDEIKIVDVFSDSECVDWLLSDLRGRIYVQ